MKINRDYLTIDQLSKKWQLSSDDIIHLGLTEQIQFTALVDQRYPDGYIQCGVEYPISTEWLHNVYYGNTPFEATLTYKESSTSIDQNKINKKYPSTLTFYPGINRLVIQNDEVDRFESINDDKKLLSGSDRECLLRTIGAMALLLIEKSATKKLGTKEKPNKLAIHRDIIEILENLNLSTIGQSKSRLNHILGEALKITLDD